MAEAGVVGDLKEFRWTGGEFVSLTVRNVPDDGSTGLAKVGKIVCPGEAISVLTSSRMVSMVTFRLLEDVPRPMARGEEDADNRGCSAGEEKIVGGG